MFVNYKRVMYAQKLHVHA